MKRCYIGYFSLLLCSCSAITQQEFLQDPQNNKMVTELSNKAIYSGCDKLVKLNKFVQIDSPKISDLAQIMIVFGLKETDATNVDKVFALDLSSIEQYSCTDIRDAKDKYCITKYGGIFDVFKQNQCLASLYGELPPRNTYDKYDTELNYVYDGKDLTNVITEQIQKIYSIPELCRWNNYINKCPLASAFKSSELIKANNTILGTYDSSCSDLICSDYETKKVNQLNAAKILYDFCTQEHFDYEYECACLAHTMYKKVNYKNIIYIYEKEALPQSIRTDYKQTLAKCKNNVIQQDNKAMQERYGETTDGQTNSDVEAAINNVVDAVQNAVWMNEQLTEKRKEIENLRDLDI